ncbi:CpaF family protein [Mycetocola zhujimingii]|uniref:CpaF family protein n=1 Tax=Mycetocola zhujimingii TaxID=2079792 RepID=A0A2U1THM2_9MICO|nr:ATPase, T2SS/T4P/T4SS family [Mycetocola zhujimingii]AWB86834.1 pilus assembly protein CpaF [Mycetocola zhujimingii]PWC08382.1 CpaF family protein [Mycetocola zhujimingii]
MSSAAQIITDRVRERVRRDGADLSTSTGLAQTYVRDEVRRYSERALAGAHPLIDDEAATEREVVASLTGLGPLQEYLDDPSVEEIWINSPTRIFIARDGVSELTNTVLTEAGVRDLVERMLQSTGRRVDLSSPFVDASLPDGSRLHVVIPDVTRKHMSVNIRKFRRSVRDLAQLVALGSLSAQAAEFLRASVGAGLNILVSGATQAGKTTLLGALLGTAPARERIVTVEETFELDLSAQDVVAMQCRQANLEGSGEITLRRLIKEALRMRPDRLIVGEVREAESLDLLIALNSGLPGMCSIHANSGRDALVKLATLPLLAGRNIDSSFVQPTVASCIDLVVHLDIDRRGLRRVNEILAVTGVVTGPVIETSRLFAVRDGLLEPSGSYPTRTGKFEAAGIDPLPILRRGLG